MRIRITRGFWSSPVGVAILVVFLAAFVAGAGVLTYYYVAFGKLIDQRLTGQIFENTSSVYTAPGRIFTGESLRESELTSYLLRAGYQESDVAGSAGYFKVSGASVEIYPSPYSYFRGRNALKVIFSPYGVDRIMQLPTNTPAATAEIEPELLTNLFDSTREKRRIVRYDDLPPDLVHALLAAEDKRFFEHGALDFVRVFGAAFYDLRSGEKAQGASTIDMQVARTFFFTTRRIWSRKLKEILMAAELNERFSKEQILELYANDIYLGNRGSFSIRGFGEGAQAYFGKDVRELNLGECAFLTGIIRSPNRYSAAEHHLDRADEARDRVLAQMVDDGYITKDQEDEAKKMKLHFVNGGTNSSAAPYFVDMVKDHLLEKFSENDLETQSYRIYTTLDPDLQNAAAEAVQIGMQQVDKLLARRYAIWKKRGEPVPKPQVALVALDPKTGEIRALVGGRNYGESQLDHALAHRQPGSVFKPFVYAAAFNDSIQNQEPIVTPSTTVDDVPTTFEFNNQDYTPNNYGEEFYGTVTVRDALMRSLNVATIKVAEMIGYQRVVDMARQMGVQDNLMATPALALGSYEMTPIELAAAYTAFADNGVRAEPLYIRNVVDDQGNTEETNAPQTRPVLDPRVSFLVTSLMEDVINHGTGYPVRAMGFEAPAAGKTGSSHDAWFSGYTSNLLCVVWVGFDDNRDIILTGGQAAAPIWGEFMKRAVALPEYHNTANFEPPDGVVEQEIDPDTGMLAAPACPKMVPEYFVAGTQPTQYCDSSNTAAQGSGPGEWLSHLFGGGGNPPPPPAPGAAPGPNRQPNVASSPPTQQSPSDETGQPEQPKEKKKSVLNKIFGIFGGDDKQPADNSKPQH
ncbi:MAG TPA: PBP1A family penicillin-binding protein [Candidatus Acidoferrales bacterium]|nr:PBP1A family penicillin-binding protein [Candidatus Acidoferrales bacterium]